MRRPLFILGIIGLVMIFAGAAFAAGQILNRTVPPVASGKTDGPCDVTRTNAPELPPEPPLLQRSVLVRRDGNSLFVGVHAGFYPVRNPDGTMRTIIQYDGPVVELVVAHDTKVYRDVTFEQSNGPVGCGQVREQVEPGTLKDFDADTTFLVWGRRAGDRVLAQTLVYELPASLSAGK